MNATEVSAAMGSKVRARAIAFYLPQFHPIPENDAWWGRGFTEWTNVVTGRPRFSGHDQPHVPAELGYYDLRDAGTREAQAEMARAHGIEAFCYYHYWFQGKRLLNLPLDEVRASGKPDFPFCLCWANESWSRAWSGRENDVLMQQAYGEEDSAAHIEWLIAVFEDPRYLRVGRRPLFLIYMPEKLPDPVRLLGAWRDKCARKLGVEPYFCAVRTGFSTLDPAGLELLGFDGVVEFEPNRKHFPIAKNTTGHAVSLLRRLLPERWYGVLQNSRWLARRSLSTVIDYAAYVDERLARPPLESSTFPVVFPSWDNSVRRKSATIIENHDAGLYRRWLEDAIARVASRDDDRRLVFVNAWNEWAEGCHLEPDKRHGRAFLEATAAALHGSDSAPIRSDQRTSGKP